eukprot:TRINITY_DN18892_c0_g1_i1.p1 TRINITY_DN18892_c0_g1~~TRINITY_DN18892_c0_g1_i1.p1  ORF type:complete len:562 (+),score=127.42 TRINITY_DN18892_c0_g1_i1:68-1753(+)
MLPAVPRRPRAASAAAGEGGKRRQPAPPKAAVLLDRPRRLAPPAASGGATVKAPARCPPRKLLPPGAADGGAAAAPPCVPAPLPSPQQPPGAAAAEGAAAADGAAAKPCGAAPRAAPRQQLVNVAWAKSSRALLELLASRPGQPGFRLEPKDNAQGSVLWVVGPFDLEQALVRRRPCTRVSRIPGMHDLCKKGAFERMARRARADDPAALASLPRTWLVPDEPIPRSAFAAGPCLFKPECGAQGTGIYFVASADEARRRAAASLGPQQGVLQRYVNDPLLLGGKKFDLRVYVLVASLEPLRVLVAREGLARVCCEPYERPARGNLFRGSSHLTNYGLNKHSAAFDHHDDPADGTRGSKRALRSALAHLEEQGVGDLWPRVRECVAEAAVTLAQCCAGLKDTGGVELWPATEPPLPARETRWDDPRWGDWKRDCFQLLGIDVLLTDDCRPVLLEANACPSLSIDAVEEHRRVPSPVSCGGEWADMVAAAEAHMRGRGRTCRCTASVKPHVHFPCAVDIAAKSTAVSDALLMLRRDTAAVAAGEAPLSTAELAAGTAYDPVYG